MKDVKRSISNEKNYLLILDLHKIGFGEILHSSTENCLDHRATQKLL